MGCNESKEATPSSKGGGNNKRDKSSPEDLADIAVEVRDDAQKAISTDAATSAVATEMEAGRQSPPPSPRSPHGLDVSDSGMSALKRHVIHNNPEEFGTADGQDEARAAVVPKSDEERRRLKEALQSHFLFADLNVSMLEGCIDVMQSLKVSAGTDVITQGETGNVFYVLEDGAAEVLVSGTMVASYGPGASFGELALMYNCERAATIRATADCKLWTMDLRTFRRLLADTASNKMVQRCEFLRVIPLLSELSNEKLTKLADALEEDEFNDGTYIIREGDQGDRFFIIESGKVRCTAKRSPEDPVEVDLTTMEAGNYFGEMALLLDEPRNANCIAEGGKVKCLSLDRQKFFLLLGPIQDVLLQNMRLRVLRSVPLLNKLTDEELDRVANALFVQSFEHGQYIIKQGDSEHTSKFYIINEGSVRITINAADGEKEVSTLTKGEYFGEGALLKDEPRSANVLANGFVDCLVLERSDFQTLLGPLEAILKRETDRRQKKGATEVAPLVRGPGAKIRGEVPLLSNLYTLRQLGTGTFGRVKLVKDERTGQTYALKCMLKAQIAKSHQQRNTMNEKNILSACQHPYIMDLNGTYNTRDELMMLSEVLLGGELWAYIYNKKLKVLPRNRFGGFETPHAQFYAATVILCLQYLHEQGIAYRDLKPENLVLNSEGYVKMIDFGFAKQIPFKRGASIQTKSFTLCGTPDYLAPELVLSRGHDKSVDLWALGVFVYELINGKTPFTSQSQSEIFKQIVRSDRSLKFPPGFDPAAEDLVRKLLMANVSFRLGNTSSGMKAVLDHAWFSTFDWEAMRQMKVPPPFTPKISKNWDKPSDNLPKEKVTPYYGNQKIFEGF